LPPSVKFDKSKDKYMKKNNLGKLLYLHSTNLLLSASTTGCIAGAFYTQKLYLYTDSYGKCQLQ
jgi:hypothetical protein